MDGKQIGSILIEKNNGVVGILTERDILRKIVAKGKNPSILTAESIMSSPVLTIDAEQDILQASKMMDQKRIRRVIITKEGKIVGKVTANSISRNLQFVLLRKSQSYTRPEY